MSRDSGGPPARTGDVLPSLEALECAPSAYLLLDAQFHVVALNRTARRTFQIPNAHAISGSDTFWKLAPWVVGGEFELRHREAMSARIACEFLHCFSEQSLPLDITLTPIGSGELVCWYRDAASPTRKPWLAEEAYRTILCTTLDGFWITDNRGRFQDVNDAYCQLIGFSRDELLAMTVRDVEAVETEEETRATIQRVMTEGSGRFLVRQRCKDGRLVDLDVSAKYSPELERFFVFLRDVTEQKSVENALRESENRYRVVAEHMQDVFYRTDMAGNLVVVSPSGASLFGVPDAQALIGMNLLTAGIQTEAETQAFFDILTTRGEVRDHETHIRTKDGTILDISTNSQFLLDENGKPIGVEGVFRDITARKLAEREKAELEAQLRQSQKLESLGRLAGGIAHDFNNILTVMIGHCELMLIKAGPDDPLRPSLLEVCTAGERAATLTRQMLAFSRDQVIHTRPIDLNQLLMESVRMVERMLGEDIEIACDLASDLGWVMADSGRLHQVMMNLMVNARDAMPAGGRVLISARNETVEAGLDLAGEYVRLEVIDTGSGMDDTVRRRVFDPFFTTKDVGKGTGLGLSMVYGIVRQLGGSIEVDSEPGAGATFRIRLPRAPVNSDAPLLEMEEMLSPTGIETILVVEDQAEVRRLAVTILQELGYEILEACDGDEALSLGEREDRAIHLLITDIVMPRMAGPELAERWRELRPDAKVLFMSGYTSSAMSRYGLNGDDTELIWKPFLPAQLARKVRDVLDA